MTIDAKSLACRHQSVCMQRQDKPEAFQQLEQGSISDSATNPLYPSLEDLFIFCMQLVNWEVTGCADHQRHFNVTALPQLAVEGCIFDSCSCLAAKLALETRLLSLNRTICDFIIEARKTWTPLQS